MKFITIAIAALIGFSSNALAAAVPASIGQVDEEHAESNFLRGSTPTIVCHGFTLSNPNGCHCPRKDKTFKAATCPKNQGVHNEATVCCTGPGAAWSWVQCSGLVCLGGDDDSADQPEEDAVAMVES